MHGPLMVLVMLCGGCLRQKFFSTAYDSCHRSNCFPLPSVPKALRQQGTISDRSIVHLGAPSRAFHFERRSVRHSLPACPAPALLVAKDERILLHYNGHGCPKPTNNGEIWVFNKVLSPGRRTPPTIRFLKVVVFTDHSGCSAQARTF